MTHDPLCPLTPPTAEYEPYLAEAVRAIQQETPCLCDLIAKVRADERAPLHTEREAIVRFYDEATERACLRCGRKS
jgi:hypothetical protein